ncbi:hypothetical protein GH741_20060 [Aquibacillus halophilus]|uniref:Uncharacterized protein n=2 Tax=Aquibacillus halophilus TaxID=930132 RepID=A0A6A8DUR4_9BACI|nr:hypothetical protein [Aquibacillus halophilus]
MGPNICRYCYKEIKDRDELVTASNFFRIKPFHFVCFNELEKEVRTLWGFWKPLNGVSGNTRAIILAIVAAWLLFTDSLGEIGDLIGVVALYSVLIRIMSYLFFEIKISKQKHH